MNSLDVIKIENSLEDELKVRIYSLVDSILSLSKTHIFRKL